MGTFVYHGNHLRRSTARRFLLRDGSFAIQFCGFTYLAWLNLTLFYLKSR